MKVLIGVLALLLILAGLVAGASLPAAAAPLPKPGHTPVPEADVPATAAPCATTPFATGAPPDANTASFSSNWYGNDVLWAAGGPWAAGPEGVKVLWYRTIPGKLTVSGQRLDVSGGELVAGIPDGYGDRGLQASGLYFPAGGCWEITGSVGGRTLRFILQVASANTGANASSATGARPFPLLASEPNGFQQTIAFTDTEGRRLYLAMYDPDQPSSVFVSIMDRTTLAIVDKKPWPAFCERLLVVAPTGTWICAYGDGEEGALVRILAIDFPRAGVPESVGYVAGRVTGAALSTAGRLFVVTQGAMLSVFDVNRQRSLINTRLARPPETAGLPGQILLSPDERRLYLGFERGEEDSGATQIVRAYDAARWNPVGDFDLTSSPAWKLSLSSNGDRLYGISALGKISAYDTATLQRVAANP